MCTRGKPAVIGAVLAACAVSVLAACGEGSRGASAGGQQNQVASSAVAPSPGGVNLGPHNDADVAFARNMIAHHTQAIEMAKLAGSRAAEPKVKDLAVRIEKSQGTDIEKMTQWLAEWHEPVTAPSPSAAVPSTTMPAGQQAPQPSAANHENMPGMMSKQRMRQLENATGAAFDKLFLKMMTEHHEGAVPMADEVRAKGTYQPAKQLADGIIATQQAEIQEMRTLLGPN